jgi:hypothetical protein
MRWAWRTLLQCGGSLIEGCTTFHAAFDKETSCNTSAHTIEKVNWDGIYGIFDLQLNEKLRLQDINKTRANSDQKCCPWFINRTVSCDTDETTEGPVHGHFF